jgi:hypothetical protein
MKIEEGRKALTEVKMKGERGGRSLHGYLAFLNKEYCVGNLFHSTSNRAFAESPRKYC